MVEMLNACVCPQCGHRGLEVKTEGWKPVAIRCRRLKNCGWRVDLKEFWPEVKKETETYG